MTPRIRRKNIRIDQVKLDRVMAILGARSEAEAIDHALDTVLLGHDIAESIGRARIGGSDRYFDDDALLAMDS